MIARLPLLALAVALCGLPVAGSARGQPPAAEAPAAAAAASQTSAVEAAEDVGSAHAEAHPPLVVHNVTIVDTVTGALHAGKMVVVEQGQIRSVAAVEDIVPPEGAVVVDGSGKFLIPGLWDMHVHMHISRDYSEVFFPMLLANGVTGCRDMHSSHFPGIVRLRQRVARQEVLGPRLVVSGPLLDGRVSHIGALAVTDADEARRAAGLLVQQGVDFLKVYNNLSGEAYFAIVDEARRAGVPFAGHVPRALQAEEASAAGQKCIEHLTGIYPEAPSELLATLAGNGTWVCPTLANQGPKDYVSPSRLKALPTAWANAVHFLGKGASFERRLGIVGALHKAGVPLLAGTDSYFRFMVLPGFSLHDELRWFVAAGLTPLEALQTATLNPARFLARLDDLGTVEQGKLADLVLLEANPLDDIRHTEKIAAVITAGRLLTKEQLRQMLDGLP